MCQKDKFIHLYLDSQVNELLKYNSNESTDIRFNASYIIDYVDELDENIISNFNRVELRTPLMDVFKDIRRSGRTDINILHFLLNASVIKFQDYSQGQNFIISTIITIFIKLYDEKKFTVDISNLSIDKYKGVNIKEYVIKAVSWVLYDKLIVCMIPGYFGHSSSMIKSFSGINTIIESTLQLIEYINKELFFIISQYNMLFISCTKWLPTLFAKVLPRVVVYKIWRMILHEGTHIIPIIIVEMMQLKKNNLITYIKDIDDIDDIDICNLSDIISDTAFENIIDIQEEFYKNINKTLRENDELIMHLLVKNNNE